MTLLPLQAGRWQAELDGQGTDILMADRALQGHAINAKKDWLSPEQMRLRVDREVMSRNPIDRLIESGMYRREYNPLAGKRPTSRGRYALRQDPWRQDSYESTGWSHGVFLPSYGREGSLVEGGEHYTWDIMLPHRVAGLGRVTILSMTPSQRIVDAMPESPELVTPAEREVATRLFDFAEVLRAADLMPPDEDEYFERPWKWDGEYQAWIESGSPPIPDLIAEATGRSPVSLPWERFVRTCRERYGSP